MHYNYRPVKYGVMNVALWCPSSIELQSPILSSDRPCFFLDSAVRLVLHVTWRSLDLWRHFRRPTSSIVVVTLWRNPHKRWKSLCWELRLVMTFSEKIATRLVNLECIPYFSVKWRRTVSSCELCWCLDLQDSMAELFGKEAALFVPSGTMGNLISSNTV